MTTLNGSNLLCSCRRSSNYCQKLKIRPPGRWSELSVAAESLGMLFKQASGIDHQNHQSVGYFRGIFLPRLALLDERGE